MSAVAEQRKITIRSNGTPLGHEIVGVDLTKELDDDTFAQIRDAYYRHSLILFRNQKLTPADQVRFTRRFGEVQIHHFKQFLLPDHPEVLRVSNVIEDGKPIGLSDAGRIAVWHTDLSYLPEPVAGSTFYAVEIPYDDDGQPLGDTIFSSTFAAYDALPEAMKKQLEGKKAIHCMTKGGYATDKTDGPINRVNYTEQQKRTFVDQAHPIVRTHPVTGQKCLYLNPLCVTGIVGMPDDESGPLLDELHAHCIRPEFQYRHKWREGDMLMWDNCSVLHLAIMDYALPKRRMMHRITLMGSTPF